MNLLTINNLSTEITVLYKKKNKKKNIYKKDVLLRTITTENLLEIHAKQIDRKPIEPYD